MAAAGALGTRFRGWPVFGALFLFSVACVAAALLAYGTGEAGIRAVIRATARIAVVFFCTAFATSSVAALWPGPRTRWLLLNRRYLGVSFAAVHFLHLLAIIALGRASAEFRTEVDAVTVIGGGLAYVFIAAMTLTSFDRTALWLGRRAWTILHKTGAYYVWLLFLQSYAPRALQSPAYVPVTTLLLLALGLRWAARRSAGDLADRPARLESIRR